jgi:hypothetical protein
MMKFSALQTRTSNNQSLIKMKRSFALLAGLFAVTFSLGANAQNLAPTVSIAAPSANASFVAPASIGMSATASDADGSVTGVAYYRDGTLIGSSSVAPYSVNWTSAPVGTYSITARATDDKGAVTISAPVSVLVKSNVAPTVSVSSTGTPNDMVGPATVSLAATASDSDGTITEVAFYNGGTLLGTVTSSPFTFRWTNVAVGNYGITARATDDKGAVTASGPVYISVKTNTPPTVGIASPQAPATFYGPGTLTVSVNVADTDGTVSKVDYYNGQTLVHTSTVSPFSFLWLNPPPGTNSITAKATITKAV